VPGELPQRAHGPGLTLADGEVPAGTSVLDTSVPAVAKLDAGLRAALRAADLDAESAGLELEVNSGWRSLAYQRELFAQAIEQYGSESEAARWVARPGTSVHEAGEAVDLGPASATSWLAVHGAAYGLCRVYANEPWHFELRPDAATDGCPATYADAAHDPRMQQ
jgi:LAS superfamily LD-carboxypeptidase LdcB